MNWHWNIRQKLYSHPRHIEKKKKEIKIFHMIFGCGIERCCEFRQPKSEYTKEKKNKHKNGTRRDRATNEGREDGSKMRSTKQEMNQKLHLAYDSNCLFVVFTTIVSLIKYRARTRSSEKKVLMCVFIENLFIFDKCTFFMLPFFTHAHTHSCWSFEWMLSIKYDEHGIFRFLYSLFPFL